ncbi:protoporphyrinogen oxidase [Thermobispora bispora]
MVVVGAGIAGLAAALYLSRAERNLRVTVLEAAPRIGGKLYSTPLAGVEIDAGAEALLAARPEAKELVRLAGLGDELVDCGTSGSAILSRGSLRPLPKGSVMGIPTDLPALARSGILSPAGLARAGLDLVLPPTPATVDVPVAAYIRARLGQEVVDRLVEPMLGGVYAGHADRLSLRATLPSISGIARTGRSLIRALWETGKRPKPAGPVFVTLRRGLGSLPEAVAKASGADVRTGVTVRDLVRTPGGWRVVTGTGGTEEAIEADGVVLAVPARVAARLLRREVPGAAAELSGIGYASVAIVTLAYPKAVFPRTTVGSGYLIPPVERRPVKAVTFSSVKWPHLAEADRDLVFVRCSIGRLGEEMLLQRDDAELAALAQEELTETLGVGDRPIDVRVTRWGGALPQYEVGHLDRIARARAAVAAQPGLALCGAAYDGVGIPACIASARTAVSQVLARLGTAGAPAGPDPSAGRMGA